MEQVFSPQAKAIERRERKPSLRLEEALVRGSVAEVVCALLDRNSWNARQEVRDSRELFQQLVQVLKENISEKALRRFGSKQTYETLAHAIVSTEDGVIQVGLPLMQLIEETRLEIGESEETTFPDMLAETIHAHFPKNYTGIFPATILSIRAMELNQTASIENPIEAGVHRYQLTPFQIATAAAGFLPVPSHQLIEVVDSSFTVRYDLLAMLVKDNKRLQAQIFAYANCRPQHIDLGNLGLPASKVSAAICAKFPQTLGSWVPPEFYDLRVAATVDPALSTDVLIGLKKEKRLRLLMAQFHEGGGDLDREFFDDDPVLLRRDKLYFEDAKEGLFYTYKTYYALLEKVQTPEAYDALIRWMRTHEDRFIRTKAGMLLSSKYIHSLQRGLFDIAYYFQRRGGKFALHNALSGFSAE